MTVMPFKPDREELNQILQMEMDLHPQSRLIDLYKLVYQAVYGATHIRANFLEFTDYLDIELKSMRKDYYPLIQDIGGMKGFLRISLTCLKSLYGAQRIAARDRLCGLIFASRTGGEINHKDWVSYWATIEGQVLEQLDHTEEELILLQYTLDNAFIPHHSDPFRTAYHPHYRIVHTSYMDEIKELFPGYNLEKSL